MEPLKSSEMNIIADRAKHAFLFQKKIILLSTD
jgi:hypothetical protein